MQLDALLAYEQALARAGTLELSCPDGRIIRLDIARWLAPIDEVDATVLDRCAGPTLDVGCGPGRFVSALIEQGTPALGVDIAETAVALTRSRGTPALLRNVFDRIPGAGRWPTILLMDGNIGIGGDPLRLLQRIHGLIGINGLLIVEAHTEASVDENLLVRFSTAGAATGPAFSWARVGSVALARYAEMGGFQPSDSWTAGGRTFLTFTAQPRVRGASLNGDAGGRSATVDYIRHH
jgi:SAM-dependent methyltransferase